MADFGLGSIAHIAPFVPNADPTSVAQWWKWWSDRFDNLLIALNITDGRTRTIEIHLQIRNTHLRHSTISLFGHTVHDLLAIMIMTAQRIYLTHSVKMSDIFRRAGQVLGMAGREICAICHLKLGGQEEITLNTVNVERLLQV